MLSMLGVTELVLLSQLVVISLLSSYRWSSSQFEIYRKFPAKKYPKFYVYSLSTELLHLAIRTLLDLCAIGAAGYVIYSRLANELDAYLCWVMITSIQLLPSLYSFITLRVASKIRHKIIKLKHRQFSMIHRSVLDYLSILYIALLAISIMLTINTIRSNELLTLVKKLGLVAVFLIANALLIRQIYLAIHGKIADKLVDENDRMAKRKEDVQRGLLGIAASVVIFSFLGLSGSQAVYQASWLIVPLSLFIQISVFHRSKRWYPINMAVYQ